MLGTNATPDSEVAMKRAQFKLSTLSLSIALAFPATFGVRLAQGSEFYPALPPTLSNSVTPNVLLYIDTSGSMGQDSNNKWVQTSKCNPDTQSGGYNKCINDNIKGFRDAVDSETVSPDTKMNIAKRVARNVVANNPGVRFGLFTFQDEKLNASNATRGVGAKLRAPVADMTDTNKATLNTAISNMWARTSTPLGEGLTEITRYFKGETSLYNTWSGSYTSPIQYRCQKNFVLVITDGMATDEDTLPGAGLSALSYTARKSNGDAVSKNFSICKSADTAADDGLTVTCPATLEGSTGTPGFDDDTSKDGYNWFRAIRDVAKYAYISDLKVGGTDGDSKSYDDPKFIKQNLITYTVGFSVDNPVLAAAATVGGGKSYKPTDEATLNAALTNAINDIVASVSNAGGVATRSEVAYASNVAIQPVFNPQGWYGELRCKNLDKSGTITGDCSTPKAIIPAAASRKIYTSQVTSSSTSTFDFTSANLGLMSTSQQAGLGADATERQNTIKWIRGEDVTDLRSRPNGKLGDMVDAQPTIIAQSSGFTTDPTYAQFKTDTASRNLVLVGANDGMMHAFDIGTMTELMGYVPHAVYRNLKSLPKTDYGQATGTPHAFFVNGSSRREDVNFPTTSSDGKTTTSNWRTILAGGLGQGGQGYYALDVTSSSTLTGGAASAVKWEWNDQRDAQIGYSFSTPIIYNVRTSATTATPAIIFSNGYESDFDDTGSNGGGQKTSSKGSALFIVNANTGALIKKIEVKNGTTELGSGLSSPAGWDYDSDGIVDYVYAGDLNGKVWRFDLTSSSTSAFSVSTTPLFDAGTTQPIVQRPGLFPTGTDGEVMVIFGSGKLLLDTDRTDTRTQALYGVVDNFKSAVSTAAKSSLVAQTIDSTYTMSATGKRAGTYRKMSANTVDLGVKRGWYIDLPGGERLVTSPMVYADKALFGTGSVQSGEVCTPGGKGWIMGLNPLTGSTPKSRTGREYSFVDIDGDDKSTTADQIPFTSGNAYAGGFDRSGMPTELTFVADQSAVVELTTDGAYGAEGSKIALREVNSMAVYRAAKYYSSGKGVVLSGTIGTDTIDRDRMLGPASGVRVETGTWKELK
ncbi:hypothetical protein C0V76_09985 [Uliginosibacterium sp. TH139]|nr:hypothetical protein C0V76_09985 [Uliginosibacterium sp. TH139]